VATHNVSVTRKNAVLGAIQAAGLDAAEFVWNEEPSEITAVGLGREPYTVEVLVHRPTGYSFRFDIDGNTNTGSLWAIYEPGPDGARRREHAGTWEYVFGYVQQWAGWLREEYNSPDLWAELRRGRAQLGGEPAEVENTPFTPQEQAEIGRQLRELKEYVRQTYQLTGEQYRAIDARLDYFAEAAGRLGRVDWRNALVGAFIGAVLQAVVPLEPVQQLLYMALRGLVSLFGADAPELPELPAPMI
jgi:hypothetical protein